MRGGNCRPAALGELNLAHHLPEEVRIRSFFRVLMTSDICNGLAEISAGRASLELSFKASAAAEALLAEYAARKFFCFLPIMCFTFRRRSTLLFAANLIDFAPSKEEKETIT